MRRLADGAVGFRKTDDYGFGLFVAHSRPSKSEPNHYYLIVLLCPVCRNRGSISDCRFILFFCEMRRFLCRVMSGMEKNSERENEIAIRDSSRCGIRSIPYASQFLLLPPPSLLFLPRHLVDGGHRSGGPFGKKNGKKTTQVRSI